MNQEKLQLTKISRFWKFVILQHVKDSANQKKVQENKRAFHEEKVKAKPIYAQSFSPIAIPNRISSCVPLSARFIVLKQPFCETLIFWGKNLTKKRRISSVDFFNSAYFTITVFAFFLNQSNQRVLRIVLNQFLN